MYSDSENEEEQEEATSGKRKRDSSTGANAGGNSGGGGGSVFADADEFGELLDTDDVTPGMAQVRCIVWVGVNDGWSLIHAVRCMYMCVGTCVGWSFRRFRPAQKAIGELLLEG